MSDRTTFPWWPAVASIALLAAVEAGANLAPIGLSEVRALWFANVAIGANPVGSFEELGSAVGAGDFDGDDADDLVIGVPTDHGIDGECVMCGAVVVRFGSPGQGLAGGAGPLLLSQEAPASPDPAEPGERFGSAVAAGDFDGDGRDDLAVGVPHDFVGETSVGGVAIYYGVDAAAGGLPTVADLVLHQGADGLPGTAAAGDWFGAALAIGDFDGDGYDDLAIGAHFDGDPGVGSSGSVTVAYGGANGLLPFAGVLLHQGLVAMADDAESNDAFGAALVTGDFDGNGYDDLAIGVPGEDGGAGGVHVVLSGAAGEGLIVDANFLWGPAIVGANDQGAPRFGESLASGNFDGDGHDDLAVGSPNDSLGTPESTAQAGAVTVLYGGLGGFEIGRTQHWTQGSVYDNAAYDSESDQFGAALAAGDFDGDGFEDLIASHPNENTSVFREGALTVMMGGGGGLVSRFRFVAGTLVGLPSGGNQHAGRALVTGDFDASGFADLAVGVPFNDVGGSNAGAAFVLYGALFADGFELGTVQRWSASGN